MGVCAAALLHPTSSVRQALFSPPPPLPPPAVMPVACWTFPPLPTVGADGQPGAPPPASWRVLFPEQFPMHTVMVGAAAGAAAADVAPPPPPPCVSLLFFPPGYGTAGSLAGGGVGGGAAMPAGGGVTFAVGAVAVAATSLPSWLVPPSAPHWLPGRYALAAGGDWLVVTPMPGGRVLMVTRRRARVQGRGGRQGRCV